MPMLQLLLNRGNTGASVRELHNQLLALGSAVDVNETEASSFGPSTVEAVSALRERYGFGDGTAVDPSLGRLMHVASVFAADGGRAALRGAVREASAAADASNPQELYWLARYATLSGDYETAHSIALLIPNHGDVRAVLDPIVAPPRRPGHGEPPAAPEPRPPELPYPENFYAYRRDFFPTDVLDDVRRQIAAVGQPPRSASQAYPGFADRGTLLIQAGVTWFDAIKQWQIGNAAFAHRNYAAAQAAYDACQSATCDYFTKFHNISAGGGTMADRLGNIIKQVATNETAWAKLWSRIRWRRSLLSLDELQSWDWPAQAPNLYIPRKFDPPAPALPEVLPPKPDFGLGFLQNYFQRGEFGEDPAAPNRQDDLESRLITLAFVLVPLARAEANRARRQFDAAIRDLRWVLDSIVVRIIAPSPMNPGPFQRVRARLACEFIELPFARLLLAETLLEKGDAEYKARTLADPPPAQDVAEFQGMKAAQTYLALKTQFGSEGQYVARVDESRNNLAEQIQQRVADNDTRSPAFQLLGKDILVPTLAAFSNTLPGMDRRLKAHEPLLKFVPTNGASVPENSTPAMRETNPRVYAVLLAATARLEQLRAGFNYLGYLDSYVPPWRFQFLLERARYFAEHAKNAQREYLNFTNNAEQEEFQELGASQHVEMEKSNLRIETARVDQAQLEVAVVQQSMEGAQLAAANAVERLAATQDFHFRMQEIADSSFLSSYLGSVGKFFVGALSGNPKMAVEGWTGALGSISEANRQNDIREAQRQLETTNLRLAIQEAAQAVNIAQAKLAAAQAGLLVTGLQRQAALLRHEFALQNLSYLRNRVLNMEQWYRMSGAIRSVSETYLRYSIELAFLAEQAYEFEADKRINVIRFDYDFSDVGDFLAADFLMRDLDTLEQDLIVTQQQRQQQVRYVLSMARDFPQALQELRDGGKTTFSLRLEQLEKRFPGIYNLRIAAVDVYPVALLDSTRFSMELTQLGMSQVRLKAHPDTLPGTPSPSPLNGNDLPVASGEWLSQLQESWPVKLQVTGPETVVFSGLTRQDANALFPFAATSQRRAFESLGAAASWQVDFTARDNQVVPGSLSDVLVTFTLSGYHNSQLRSAIDTAPRSRTAVTRWISARTTFPDTFYEFNRTGRMVWKVTRDLLTLTGDLGAVRNAALLLLPAATPANSLGRVMSRYEVRLRVTSTGELEILSEIPQVSFEPGGAANPLSLAVHATVPAGGEVSWDFGDGSALQSGADQEHTYLKPGRYVVAFILSRNGRLSTLRSSVVVSRAHADLLTPPLTVYPTVHRDTSAGIPEGHTRLVGTLNASATDSVVGNWRVGSQAGVAGDHASFDLAPGDYTLVFTAVRKLKALVYCNQRHLTTAAFELNGLNLASNRRFDPDGTEITGVGNNPAANLLTTHLFGQGPLLPEDEWSIELPLSDNGFLRSVSATDVEEYDVREIEDAVLALEYETTGGSS